MSKEQPPAPSISGLSRRSQKILMKLAQSHSQGQDLQASSLDEGLDSLKADLDGQPLVLLEESLDWLRETGIYDLSIPLLEEAWSSDLPLDFLGRVAQDWVGSVLFGLGDEKGARQVAAHLAKRAQELGPAFCSDLCDMWLEWGLFSEAEPLAQFVHNRQPGDMSALFHLMICAKMRLAWDEARSWLEQLDQRRALNPDTPLDPAIEWNRGIIAVAQRKWVLARQAWAGVGFTFPDQPDQPKNSDYATPGELSPIRLKIDIDLVESSKGHLPRSEVVWGTRIGPARVELTGIPYYHPTIRSGDILLLDGVQEGKVDLNGENYPVSPALTVWSPSKGETFRLYGAQKSLKEGILLERFIQKLGEQGWAIANWTRMIRKETPDRDPLIQVALYLPPDRELSAFHTKLNEFMASPGAPQLYNPRYAELAGEDREIHEQVWIKLGLVTEQAH